MPPTLETNAAHQGRAELADWMAAQPQNYYLADDGLERTLTLLHGAEECRRMQQRLTPFGAAAAGIDAVVRENNLHANLPQLEARDGIGRVVDAVRHHPGYHAAGRVIHGSGVMQVLADAQCPNSFSLALTYLSAMNGEAGHNCPLACTAGVIKVLQYVADDALRARFLPRLLDPDYARCYRGAQFLTEVQGGSDVGANAVIATAQPDAPGRYRLHGQKWFCSVIDADLALLSARIVGGADGTRGLGLFLLPLRGVDGAPNGYRVWRLKDKLGTRSMASGEIELDGALAYCVGDPQQGFRQMMRHVIHTSRLFNAVAVLGMMRRACVVGHSYARHRRAFGHPIGRYPLVQETLADMRADTAAVRAATFRLLWIQDQAERHGLNDADTLAAQRMAVNLNKTLSARYAHRTINQGIELLGGNGTVESFSVLPRLLRDNVVCENWEGTHNTLLVQWLRDAATRDLHRPFYRWLAALFDGVDAAGAPWLAALRQQGLTRVAAARDRAEAMLDADEGAATLLMRRVGDESGNLLYFGSLLHEAAFAAREQRADAADVQRLTEHFYLRRVANDTEAPEAAYLERLAGIWERI